MKYIKIFESDKINGLTAKYDIDDLVLVYSDYNFIFNEAMRILCINYKDQISYDMKFCDNQNDIEYLIMEWDVVRKLEQDEIDAIKFNI